MRVAQLRDLGDLQDQPDRALARDAPATCGGPGVSAVGMCLTGGFALAMMVDDTTIAPVLSQPSMPFPISASRRRDGLATRSRM